MPMVSHERGEIVYMDLIGSISEKISLAKYLLTMMDRFSPWLPPSAVLNTWVKGVRGIPKTFHTDNGKE